MMMTGDDGASGDDDDDVDDVERGQLNREESINLKLMNILCQEM